MTAQDDRRAAEEIAEDADPHDSLVERIFAALQKAREEERVLSPKAIRFVIPALLNEAARHEHLAEVAAGLNQRFPSPPTRTEKP